MPLYDYACTKCGRVREVRHGFDESYAEACEACGGSLKRVFNPAPILFKGSGFYVTDSRRPAEKSGGESSSTSAAKSDATTGADPKTAGDAKAAGEAKKGSGAADSAA